MDIDLPRRGGGRQMQTRVRFPAGWKVVAAHVSMIDAAAVWTPR